MGNKEALFAHLDSQFEAVTYSQLRIRNEQISDVLWQDADVSGRLSTNFEAPVPIIASPMTTVSGVEMAIAMAKLGGAAGIPHSYDPETQRGMLRQVKHQLKTKINDPIVAQSDHTFAETLKRIEESDAKPTTLPVQDNNGKFVGLLTRMHFDLNRKNSDTPVGSKMTPAQEVITSDPDTDVNKAYLIMQEHGVGTLPLIDEKGEVKGMYLLPDVLRAVEGSSYNVDKFGKLVTVASVSTFEEDAIARMKVIEKYTDIIIMDTSHGELRHALSAFQAMKQAMKVIRRAREEFTDLDIMIGNVSEASTALELAKLEPNAIRIGQGPGGICISGEVLGGGCPQATAVYEICKALEKAHPEIAKVADGGITGPADITKARALGADAIIVGGLVAATNEAPPPIVQDAKGRDCKAYNGEGSATEQQRSLAGRHRYGDEDHKTQIFVEGVEKLIPLKGSVDNIINNAVTGMKKQMSASGFKDVATMQRDVSFWKVGGEAIAAASASK